MYLAPELMHMATTYSKHTGEQGGYTKAVDCWSLGVILYVWYVQYIYNTSLLGGEERRVVGEQGQGRDPGVEGGGGTEDRGVGMENGVKE